MALKDVLIDFWENNICEGHNRKVNRDIIKASKLWHKGSFFSKLRSISLSRKVFRRSGCEVYPQASIEDDLYIPHCVGIVIGNTAVIGKDCKIFPNVIFGASHSPSHPGEKGRRHPKVGDGCVIGANSSIIGRITIGNNVTVGAGAVVTKDIPDGATVVGVNQIIGYRDNDN